MTIIFLLLIFFQIKHFVLDYPLQTPYMLKKFLPGWDFLLPLAAHAGAHGFATTCFILGFKPSMWWLGIVDFVIHFAMDRIKAGPKYLGKYKALAGSEFASVARAASYTGDSQELLNLKEVCQTRLKHNTYFWWALGLDQAVHHFTHYLIIYLLVR